MRVEGMSPRKRNDSNERQTMRLTERKRYTATDSDGNTVATNLTRKQATALVNAMEANGVAVRIHPTPGNIGAFRRQRFFILK